MDSREELLQIAEQARAEGNLRMVRYALDKLKALDAEIPAAPQQPQFSGADGMSGGEKFLAGIGQGMMNTVRGAGQLTGLIPDAEIAKYKQLDKPLLDTGAGTAGSITGNVASMLPLPGGTLGKNVLGGAMAGLLTPRDEGDTLAGNAALGGAGGLLATTVLGAGGRVLRPVRSTLSDAKTALADKAAQYGIELTPAQITGSKPLKWIESVMEDLPLTSAKQEAVREGQRKQFNGALAGLMGSNADNLNEATMTEIKNRVGGGIGDIAGRNKLNFDYDTFNNLVKNQFDAQKFETSGTQSIINNYIDDILSKVEPDGTISGEAYRKLDSALGSKVRSTSDGDLRYALGQLRETMRTAMDKSISPADAAEWSKLRGQYAYMKKLEPVAAKSVEGDVNPVLVKGAALRGDKNAAYRTNDLLDLGDIGQEFLKPLPSSGTAQRVMYQKLLTSPVSMFGSGAGLGYLGGGPEAAVIGGLLSGAATSGAAALPLQKLLHSKAGRKYFTKGILPGMQALENPIMRYLAGPGGAAGLLGYNQ